MNKNCPRCDGVVVLSHLKDLECLMCGWVAYPMARPDRYVLVGESSQTVHPIRNEKIVSASWRR